MKKAFLVMALATFVAFVSCNCNKQKIDDADASTQINVPDSIDEINVEAITYTDKLWIKAQSSYTRARTGRLA